MYRRTSLHPQRHLRRTSLTRHVALPDRQAFAPGKCCASITRLAFDQQGFDVHEHGVEVGARHAGKAAVSRATRQAARDCEMRSRGTASFIKPGGLLAAARRSRMKAGPEFRVARLPLGNAWQCPRERRPHRPVFSRYLGEERGRAALVPEALPRICRLMKAARRQPVLWRIYAFVPPR